MARKMPRINMLATWGRNVNPDLRVCSIIATYSRQARPRIFSARIAFRDERQARDWAEFMPAYVNAKVGVILAHGSQTVAWLRLDVDVARRDPKSKGLHAPSIKRVRAFLAHVRRSDMTIDYQSDNTAVVSRYGYLDMFETALESGNSTENPAPIVAYAD